MVREAGSGGSSKRPPPCVARSGRRRCLRKRERRLGVETQEGAGLPLAEARAASRPLSRCSRC